jgi:hypothetical protein
MERRRAAAGSLGEQFHIRAGIQEHVEESERAVKDAIEKRRESVVPIGCVDLENIGRLGIVLGYVVARGR